MAGNEVYIVLAMLVLFPLLFMRMLRCNPAPAPDTSGQPGTIQFNFYAEGLGSYQDVSFTIHWQAQLLTRSGTTGQESPIDVEKPYAGQTTATGTYSITELSPPVMPGTWMLSASSGDWVATCQRQVAGGQLSGAWFRLGQSGCG